MARIFHAEAKAQASFSALAETLLDNELVFGYATERAEGKTMLQLLTVKNFKLFDDAGVTIKPGKVTVFVGINGTGKSSLLQVLLLLKQSRHQSKLVFDGPLINVGSFRDLAHLQDTSHPLEVDIVASYDGFIVPSNTAPQLPPSGAVQYKAIFSDGTMNDQRLRIGGEGGESLSALWATGSLSPERIVVEGVTDIALRQQPMVGFPLAIAVHSNAIAAQSVAVLNKVYALLQTIDQLLRDFHFVPAIRGFDSLSYEIWSGDRPGDLMAAGGPEKQASLVANVISSSPDLVDEVTARLNAILQSTDRLRYRIDQGRLVSEMASQRKGINLVNEAFGLNQLVAPLLWLSKAPHGSVIGIEVPEIHLHPRAQAALCDVFVEVATQEQKQLILTTHSEHIVMGLLTAVADRRLRPEDLAVYEFRRDGDAARAERLEVSEYGQIAGGLKGFLETDIDELGDLIQARFQKQR